MRFLLALAGALSLSACAFGDETLTLAAASEEDRKGVISEAPSTEISLGEIVDARPDRKPVGKDETADPKRPYFIGYKKNGYGQNTANILSEEAATETVSRRITKVLEANGHSVVDGDAAAILDIEVVDLFLEVKTGLVTVEFFGNAKADLTLRDAATGEVLYEESFVGYNSQKTGGGLSGTWTKILDAALDDLARQISLSAELRDALMKAGSVSASDEATS